MALTNTEIRKAKPTDRPFKLADSGGLYLMVTPTDVPAPIVWTHICNSGRLSHGISLTDFKG